MEGKLETPFQMENTKVWIAGHRGLVGGAIAKRLSRENCTIVTIDRDELDLRDQVGVKKWLKKGVFRTDVHDSRRFLKYRHVLRECLPCPGGRRAGLAPGDAFGEAGAGDVLDALH